MLSTIKSISSLGFFAAVCEPFNFDILSFCLLSLTLFAQLFMTTTTTTSTTKAMGICQRQWWWWCSLSDVPLTLNRIATNIEHFLNFRFSIVNFRTASLHIETGFEHFSTRSHRLVSLLCSLQLIIIPSSFRQTWLNANYPENVDGLFIDDVCLGLNSPKFMQSLSFWIVAVNFVCQWFNFESKVSLAFVQIEFRWHFC